MMLSFFLPLFILLLFVGLPVVFAMIAAPALLLWLNGALLQNSDGKGFTSRIHAVRRVA
jgi:hypothetical protein